MKKQFKQPKSKLPWFILGHGVGNKEGFITENVEHTNDLVYIIQATNNYPKAVELLKKCIDDGQIYSASFENEIIEFLKSIE